MAIEGRGTAGCRGGKKTFYQVITLQDKEKILSLLVKTNQDLLESVQARLSQAEVSTVDISLTRGELFNVKPGTRGSKSASL